MNTSMLGSIALGLALVVASAPLHAQNSATSADKAEDTVAKVVTDGGVIMLSEGATEFQTALPDQRVKPKTRLMVSEESSATVVYDDGCDQKYDKPGVYEISATCALPVALVSSGGVSKGWVAAGVLVGAALGTALHNDCNCRRCPPVSR